MIRDHLRRPGTSRAADPERGDLIQPRRLLRLWAEHGLPALALALAAAGLAAWLLLRQPPVYAATATLFLEPSGERVLDIKQVVDDNVDTSLTDALMLTHLQQIQNPDFLRQVAASFSSADRTSLLALYGRAPAAGEAGGTAVAPVDRVEDLIARNLKVQHLEHTLLITITMRLRAAALAQRVANQMGSQYIAYLLTRSNATNDSALSFLTAQAEELRRRLETAEREMQDYRAKNHLVLLDHDQGILNDRLKSLSSAATQAQMTRLGLDERLRQLRSILKAGNGGDRELALAPEFAGLGDDQKQIDQLRGRRAVMVGRYGPMHPLMVENAVAIQEFEKLKEQQVASGLAEIQAERDKAQSDETRFQAALTDAENDSSRLDQLAVRDGELRRQVDTIRDSYTQILARLNQTTISSRLQNTNLKFIAPAVLPDRPAEPNPLQVIVVAAMIGLIIFAGYPWVAAAVDKRVRSWTEIENDLQVPLLAELPVVSRVPASKRHWIVAKDLDELTAEGFRSLRSQIQLVTAERPKTLIVTSSVAAEGKSFVAANLAASFAAQGCRTILIDADFRRPSQHKAFQMDNAKGILTWDGRTNDSLGIARLVPNLDLLRSGGHSRKMTELLEGGRMGQLLDALERDYDLLIIDAPPAGIFPDAEVLARRAAKVIYVCRFKGPSRPHVLQVLDRMASSGIETLGVALNALPIRRFGPNYFSHQGYSAQRYASHYAQSR